MKENEHNCCGGHNHNENGCCGGHNNNDGGCCGGHSHNENGCCGHNHEEEYMTLLFDDNKETKCSVIDIFEVEDKEYIALLPVGDDTVLLFEYIEFEDETFDLKNIETEEEFEKVQNAFFELLDEDIFSEEDDGYEYDYDDYDDEEDEEEN